MEDKDQQPTRPYDPKALAEKWEHKWEADKIYEPDIKKAKKPFYNLMMFPYPSAEGLHIGHVYTFGGIDTLGRFKRMQGYDVFEPMGLDAFGIHSENYALKTDTHPQELSERTEKNFYRQMRMMANSYDWSHKVETNKPDYYKWTQWIFLQLYNRGLVERKVAPVNWCPSCLTVLSDEQVIAGKCERCGTEVVMKDLEQWFIKITEYAERLLKNLDWIDWDESVKTMQKNWIGKKVGAEISFKVQNLDKDIKVFTTRPDTLFGVTALVLSPEHPLAVELAKDQKQSDIEKYIKEAAKKSELDRISEAGKAKTGVRTELVAINPINEQLVPIYVADYVLGNYGTGAIMLVPGHDQRDFDFASAFDIEIKQVIKRIDHDNDKKNGKESVDTQKLPIEEYGVLINSDKYDGLISEKASENIITTLEQLGAGRKEVTYHLRDWLISRQRYWGPPIPIIYCDKCGIVPVPENQLPVLLPHIKDFRPQGTGKSPLANHPEFYETTCPTCGGPATRETDVSDTFLDSSWYFLRYPSVPNDKEAFDPKITQKWLPVNSYIGGKEHSVLHLLYSRFVTMVLHDMGLLSFEEPFESFRANGLIIKDGAKMSKSKGNVINPDEYIEKYGIDVIRTYLMFIGPFDIGGDIRDQGIVGIERFMNRLWQFIGDHPVGQAGSDEAFLLNKTIKKVTEDIEVLHYNTAIAALMELLNGLQKQPSVSKEAKHILLQLLAPFAPVVTEELWEKMGQAYSIHTSQWPAYDASKLVRDTIDIIVQVNGKTRDKLTIASDTPEKDIEAAALKLPKVAAHVSQTQRVIHVPNKLVNIVS